MMMRIATWLILHALAYCIYMMHSYCLLHYYALDSGHDEADFGNKPNQGKFDHLNLIMDVPRVQMYVYVAIANSIAGVCPGT